MNFPFFIAKRYFVTNKSNNFVHIISWVSMFGVVVGTAALILLLSVFNGFEQLVLELYSTFDPHLKITATQGKTFNPETTYQLIADTDELAHTAFVLQENALLKYKEKEFIATVKGVSESYAELSNFDSLVLDGAYINQYENNNVAVVGKDVAYYLSMVVGNMFEQLKIFVPNRNTKTLLNPQTAFKQSAVLPVGIFSVQAEVDAKYIITPLAFLQQLLNKENEVSAIEIKLKDEHKMLDLQEHLQAILGHNFKIVNRYQQQELLYKILNTEKLAVFLILTFVMVIATFNIIGSLSMLMLDKKNDINTLRSLGSTIGNIRTLFFTKSMLTILSGTLLGLFIGLLLAYLQQTFGFISMGGGSFVIEAYPVVVQVLDIFIVSATVIIIGAIASWYPARILSRKLFKN